MSIRGKLTEKPFCLATHAAGSIARNLCKIKGGLLLLLLLFATSSLWAQTSYPVQVNVMVTPPNSVYLTDYYTRGSEKLKVQLLLKEVSRPSFPVKLRFRIEGSALRLNSRSGVNLPPFTLQGGVLVEAAGDALAPYLNLNALVAEGADASSFQSKGQRMADGFYKIEVWAEEMGRSVRVSNIATTFISTMLYQSPLITTPTDRAVFPDQGIQNIIFQWMPRHLGASADVTQSSYYKLKLVEVWPTDRDPQEAIRSSKPLYEGMSISTTFVYGPSQPTLISGRRYALQVQAQDADQRDLFVGQGYSNVVCFTYGEECQIPQGLNVEVKGPNNATAIWNANPKSTGYTIAYRKVYGSDTTWKEQPLGVPTYGMDGLVAQSSYQVRVAASCGLAKSLWSQPRRFTTPDKPDTKFECGKNPDIPNITDRTLYPNLKDGDRIQAADFKVEVLTASLDNNGYSGSGIARIPFLRNAPAFCYFKGAKINKDLQLYEGSIVLADSVTVISKKMVNEGVRLGKDVLNSLKNKNPNSTVIVAPVSGTITATSTATSGAGADTFMSGGKTTVTATTSTGQTATSTPGTNTKVPDDAGNVVAVSQNGTVTKGKQDKDAFGKGVTNSEAAPVASDDKLPKVTLTLDTSKPYYGYDTSNSQEPWVSIETGKSVSVIASITKQQSAIDESAIRYRTNDGMVVEATGTNPATLDVKGLYSNTAIPILAVADTGRVDSLKTAFICGKINTVGYDPEHRRVWLVPVNGAKVDKDAIAKKLNEVYHQAVVKWDVQYDPSIMSLTLTDQELKGICDSIKVGLVANYTLAMQAALKKIGREPEECNYILFMVPGKADATGFMPLNRSAGFIYLQGQSTNAIARTVAHELGHGAFGLDHVGSAKKDANLAATDNLMDYNGGTNLDKAQWDGIHSEYRRIPWFQGEDEGTLQLKQGEYLGFTPNGHVIKDRPSDYTYVFLSKDSYFITGFEAKNKDVYTWNSDKEMYQTTSGKEFKGWCSEPITGKVAIWNPNFTSQCFNLYKFINVDNYKHTQIDDINKKIQDDDGKDWLIDLVSNASDDCKENAKATIRKLASRHSLLFVNGYRGPAADNENTDNNVTTSDRYEYWDGIDKAFIERLKDGNVYYADGHMSIKTSNHVDMVQFYCSAKNMIATYPSSATEAVLKYVDNILYAVSYNAHTNLEKMCDGIKFNTTPNVKGFKTRRSEGEKAGKTLLQMMKNNKTIFKNKDGNIVDTLDIVCHSMGYAYALGMIDALKDTVPFGRFYILAPENAGCDGTDWYQFTEVWQYGSNEKDTKGTPPDKQDGVAPQNPVKGIERLPSEKTKGGRAYIPTDGSVPCGFLSSHSIGNYTWIFDNHLKKGKGYVIPR